MSVHRHHHAHRRAVSVAPSLLRLSLAARLGVAGVLVAAIWLAVAGVLIG
ncbi:hypothetical protein [Blastochloris tepida]|jgi:hypothetical protein|nr:hypothetical protein [Blastochloris tepida]